MSDSNPLQVPVSAQRKAILSALVAGVGSLALALSDEVLTVGEGAYAASLAVAAYAAVFGVTNKGA